MDKTFSLSNELVKHKISSSSTWGILYIPKKCVFNKQQMQIISSNRKLVECSYDSFLFQSNFSWSVMHLLFLDDRGYLELCTFLKYNIINTFMATLIFLYFFLQIHFFYLLVIKTFQILKNLQNVQVLFIWGAVINFTASKSA